MYFLFRAHICVGGIWLSTYFCKEIDNLTVDLDDLWNPDICAVDSNENGQN